MQNPRAHAWGFFFRRSPWRRSENFLKKVIFLSFMFEFFEEEKYENGEKTSKKSK